MGKTLKTNFIVGGLQDERGRQEIEDNLKEIDGVVQVKASVADGMVDIEFDPQVIRSEYIERTLTSLGYTPYLDAED